MLTRPIVARFHRPSESNSATEMLKLLRSRSFRLRSTCRLSFRDCACSILNSRVRDAIMQSFVVVVSRWQKQLMTNDNRPATTLGNYLCRNALGSKRFDDVAHLYIAVVGDGNTALHAVADFAGIIFEAAQRAHFAGEDHDIVTQQADFGVALDDAVCDLASGDRADFRNAEGLAHLRLALVSFLDSRLEETAHSALDLVLQLVN